MRAFNMSVDMSNIFMVADTVFVLHIHNRPFSWVNETVYNTLMDLDDYSITILFDTEEKSRFACGQSTIMSGCSLTSQLILSCHNCCIGKTHALL